ncbi:MAG: 16S rRNA (uracil(1498)-N(3))-methyltransferase [Gammaproteobacteria bacterium]|nr:16S rRNA (uracil(1498)-N(3))-methyltransferase [Gammaproteobacteria bacterium]MBT8110766.1 16S rRNA (uracil(1498)-N(3))-methyltransferase [Gammaproteobacteria bacterium]NND48295.1 16S rRNA (uracil(1498)-N(3))-methyltransferase [Woeseiaceae bacterium]NNL45465.1 16S rRNA (uracil(1498)-N(3))-methyltransferase [Woeseiaceae bacterium]
MPRTRLHIAGTYSAESILELDADKARYLGRVLRRRVGDSLLIFDGEGNEYAATIGDIGKTSATLHVGSRVASETETRLRVHLVQGISRGERMDFVVQKATELGVKRITPVLAEYGVVRLDAKRAEKRRDHWQKVAVSACEQSGRVRLPLVDAPVSLKTWLGNKPGQVDAELVLKPGAATPLARIQAPETKVCVLIGPEGGFSDTEYEDADIAGFQPVSLGPRVLRTETAAIAALAILQSLWGDLR